LLPILAIVDSTSSVLLDADDPRIIVIEVVLPIQAQPAWDKWRRTRSTVLVLVDVEIDRRAADLLQAGERADPDVDAVDGFEPAASGSSSALRSAPRQSEVEVADLARFRVRRGGRDT
jgi:hypothetical protein